MDVLKVGRGDNLNVGGGGWDGTVRGVAGSLCSVE